MIDITLLSHGMKHKSPLQSFKSINTEIRTIKHYLKVAKNQLNDGDKYINVCNLIKLDITKYTNDLEYMNIILEAKRNEDFSWMHDKNNIIYQVIHNK